MDSQSLQSPITPPTPPRSDPGTPTILSRGETRRSKRQRLGWAPPALQIPEPQGFSGPPSRLSVSQPLTGNYSANISVHGLSPHPKSGPYLYSRKASKYMFSQFNDIKDFTIGTARSGLGIGEKCSVWCYNKLSNLSRQWFTHIFLTVVIVVYTVGGALMFISVEGPFEKKIVNVDLRTKRRDLLLLLRNFSLTMPDETSMGEWHGHSAMKLKDFENEVIEWFKNYKLLMSSNENATKWTFWNSVFYCSTIYTTIGYGHLYPSTPLGQGLTILYALIGIPLFLIILTDFGKLFTRCIKYVWAFFRRLCYTGRCRKVRKTAHVEDIFKGAQIVYDIATLRRPSMFDPNANVEDTEVGTITPGTPAPSNFEIDDQFNLPISLALSLLVMYILLGAVAFQLLEGWTFFTSFYFVFVSMSTIGFGDYVPEDHTFMIFTIIYLVFGLALMSMCINVVQDKLSDTFKQASAKLGATLGVAVNEEDGSITTVPPDTVEMPEVHHSETGSLKASPNAV